MSDSSSIDPRLRRSDALDGLRTIAVAFVVLYHFHVPGFGGGFIGVNVFFVLSGYLITSILLREHRATGRIRLGAFWLRRILRLYPALLVMVLVGVTLWMLLGNDGGANVAPQSAALLALSYTGNVARSLAHLSQGVFAPTWSLATEEQFYLVWPPILFLLLSRRARVGAVLSALVALVVVSSAAGWLLYDDRGGSATPDIYFNPIFNVAPLLMGCILAIGLAGERMRRALAGRIGTLLAAVGLAGIVVIQFMITADWKQLPAVFGLVLPAVGLASACFIAGTASRRSVVSRALSLRPLAWFGRNMSYSLYLWHVVVLDLVLMTFSGPLARVIAIALALAAAALSHFLIERPFGRLKERWEPKRAQRAAQPAQPDRQPQLKSASGAVP
jgi:peptidoglycan/LPS O-acetylase OafA/YrhL